MIRNRSVLAVALCCVAVTVFNWSFPSRSTSSANAQEVADEPSWEYKSVKFPPNSVIEQTEILNRLGTQGWEYVGLIAPPYNGKHVPYSYVAFRRTSR